MSRKQPPPQGALGAQAERAAGGRSQGEERGARGSAKGNSNAGDPRTRKKPGPGQHARAAGFCYKCSGVRILHERRGICSPSTRPAGVLTIPGRGTDEAGALRSRCASIAPEGRWWCTASIAAPRAVLWFFARTPDAQPARSQTDRLREPPRGEDVPWRWVRGRTWAKAAARPICLSPKCAEDAVAAREGKGGLPAQTRFEPQGAISGASPSSGRSAAPRTGRKHQGSACTSTENRAIRSPSTRSPLTGTTSPSGFGDPVGPGRPESGQRWSWTRTPLPRRRRFRIPAPREAGGGLTIEALAVSDDMARWPGSAERPRRAVTPEGESLLSCSPAFSSNVRLWTATWSLVVRRGPPAPGPKSRTGGWLDHLLGGSTSPRRIPPGGLPGSLPAREGFQLVTDGRASRPASRHLAGGFPPTPFGAAPIPHRPRSCARPAGVGNRTRAGPGCRPSRGMV